MSCENFDPNFNISVYAELKPQLGTAQVFLGINRQSRRRQISLTISRHYIEVRWSKRNVHILHFPGIRLVPTTSHNMQFLQPDQLHFRVQVRSGLPFSMPLLGGVGNSNQEDLSVFEEDHVSLCCAYCRQCLISPQRFKRVLPLPSDNWYEMSDSAFCCAGHKTETTENESEANKSAASAESGENGKLTHGKGGSFSINPREGDCLVGETHFLFHTNSLNAKSVKTNKISGSVTCARCSAVIGQNMSHDYSVTKRSCDETKSPGCATFKLYRLCVLHPGNPTDMDMSRREHLSLEVSGLLLRLSQKYNSFRFVLESREQGAFTPQLLVWLLDSKCEQLIGETDATQREKEVTSQPVLKVLYLDTLRDKHASISSEWGKDLLVQSVDLPASICLQILSLLTESTQVLPDSLRVQKMDGSQFYMGFLQRRAAMNGECKGRAD